LFFSLKCSLSFFSTGSIHVRFSVILPIHHSASTVAAALDSLLSQTFTDYEVIVVDDASSDSSVEIVSHHPLKTRYVRLPLSRGPGPARNAGIDQAEGEYVTFLDSDDVWFPWTLATLDAAIRSHSHPTFVSGTEVRGLQPPPPEDAGQRVMKTTFYHDFLSTASQPLWLGVCGVAIARTALYRVGGFAEWNANCEDTDLWIRLGCEPGFVRIESPALFFYRQLPASLTRQPGRIAEGYRNLVINETRHLYPGGTEARRQRWESITRHTRAGSCNLLCLGRYREAFSLYKINFCWNLALLKFKYLLGFWFLA
jgi:glycosyltransferase involved in cell wall biosynthesis